jgi:uncharacterized protein YjbJ (UPF0337 family)
MGEIIDKVKGKAKQLEGELTGDDARKSAGVADQIKGDIKGVIHKTGVAAEDIAATVKGALRNDNSRP